MRDLVPMRVPVLPILLVLACDAAPAPAPAPANRALDLCADFAQVCPLGEADCGELHSTCLAGDMCGACEIAAKVPALSCELLHVCEDHHVPSLCAATCGV